MQFFFFKLSYAHLERECLGNDVSDAHFDYSRLFSDAQVEKVGNPKICEN
jgi:hypothetical protein